MKGATCSNCRFWSQWLSTTGDCMAYAYKRREAMIFDEDTATFDQRWPQRAAPDTQADETCAQHEPYPNTRTGGEGDA